MTTTADDDVAEAGSSADNPYLQGNFAPVLRELTVDAPLPVDGAIPPVLEGMLLRNGPNPAVVDDPARYHWFSGDGMIHAIELRDGAAVSYRNRWVRTRKFAAQVGTPAPSGPAEAIDGPANTHVVCHAGRILALVESGFPHRLGSDLSTLGVEDFDGMLTSPMTAHPHMDPATGAMAFFGYDVFGPPYLRYHEVEANGALTFSTEIDTPRATMMHDFALTTTRAVFLDLPVVFDIDLAMAGRKLPFRWRPDAGARIGVLDRRTPGSGITWVSFDPCYVFHVMNAYDDGTSVVLDVVRYDTMFDTGEGELIGSTMPSLERWVVDPVNARVSTTRLDDRTIEFPRIDDSLAGLPYRFGYCTAIERQHGVDAFPGIIRYDLGREECKEYSFGPGTSAGEPVFIRDPDGRADDEGWVLTVVYDAGRDASDLVILDASSFSGKPEAVVHLPARIPFGFHGSWMGAAQYR